MGLPVPKPLAASSAIFSFLSSNHPVTHLSTRPQSPLGYPLLLLISLTFRTVFNTFRLELKDVKKMEYVGRICFEVASASCAI